MTDLLLGPPDGLPLAAGVWPGNQITIVTVGGGGGYRQVFLGAVTPAASQVLWPLLTREPDGRWRVGVSTNTGWQQWHSTDLAGADWETEDADTGPAAGLSAAHLWPCADGSEVLIGYRRTSGDVAVLYRRGPGDAWTGPYLQEATAGEVHPYITELQTGEVECGWLLDGVWTRRHAPQPAGDWS